MVQIILRENGKVKQILKVLLESDTPLKPSEIAILAKVKHSTVRTYLRRLLDQDLVTQPSSQFYVAKMGYDSAQMVNLELVWRKVNQFLTENFPSISNHDGKIGFVSLGKHLKWHGYGFHNIVLNFETSLNFSERNVHDRGDVKFTITYGQKKGQVTARINCVKKCKYSRAHVVPYLFLLVSLKCVKELIGLRLGTPISKRDLTVKCFELHSGFLSLRMEGIENLPLTEFEEFVVSLARIHHLREVLP